MRGLQPAVSQNVLVPRLTASICSFSVVCQGTTVCIGFKKKQVKEVLHPSKTGDNTLSYLAFFSVPKSLTTYILHRVGFSVGF